MLNSAECWFPERIYETMRDYRNTPPDSPGAIADMSRDKPLDMPS